VNDVLGLVCVQEKDVVRLKREARAKGGFYVEPEAKVVFVVRIRGLNKVAPKVRAPVPRASAPHAARVNDQLQPAPALRAGTGASCPAGCVCGIPSRTLCFRARPLQASTPG
jgi:hypothetical protein